MISKEQPTILHVLSSNRFSGAENVVVGLIRDKGGVYCSPDGGIRETLREYGIKYMGLKKLTVGRLRPVIDSLQPDIIYAHDFRASLLLGYFFGKRYDVVSYIHQNPDWLDHSNLRTLLYRTVMNRFKKIVVVSDRIRERRLFKGPISKKVSVQYNRVDKSRINELAGENNGQNYDFCFVGRFSDVKQPDHFVTLISKIKKSIPQVRAVMVGDGEHIKKIIGMIDRFGLEDNIDVVGFQKNPYKYIKASKFLVLTSKNEGLPMVVLEAVALGKCVLTYSYPTLSAIFSSSKVTMNGICANSDDMYKNAITLMSHAAQYESTVTYQAVAVESIYLPEDAK